MTSRVISSDVVLHDNFVYAVVDDAGLLAAKTFSVQGIVFIPRFVQQIVAQYWEGNPHFREALLNEIEPGCVEYWEENYHDKIAKELSQKYGISRNYVSNALGMQEGMELLPKEDLGNKWQ